MQAGIPFLLGSLVDFQQTQWAVELAERLMYDEEDYGADVDYTIVGWCMSQVCVCVYMCVCV
jgi:hypothetical protein